MIKHMKKQVYTQQNRLFNPYREISVTLVTWLPVQKTGLKNDTL